MYSVRGRTTATGAVVDRVIAALWNPHATQRVKVIQYSLVVAAAPAANAGFKLKRISSRGTPGSTETPGLANHSIGGIAPPSGLLLDLGSYSVEPTLLSAELGPGWPLAAVAASGFIYPIPAQGIEIAPGTGLALCNATGVIVPISDVSWAWMEDW